MLRSYFREPAWPPPAASRTSRTSPTQMSDINALPAARTAWENDDRSRFAQRPRMNSVKEHNGVVSTDEGGFETRPRGTPVNWRRPYRPAAKH
jgi:hypothetical protein